jgi:hypothetical protein
VPPCAFLADCYSPLYSALLAQMGPLIGIYGRGSGRRFVNLWSSLGCRVDPFDRSESKGIGSLWQVIVQWRP